MNNLIDCDYIFVFTSIVQGQIIIEDHYLKATPIPLYKFEDMIGSDLVKGIFIFSDNHFNVEEIKIKKLPITLVKLDKENDLNSFIFKLLKKANIDQISNCIFFNKENLKLVPINSSKIKTNLINLKNKTFVSEEINPRNLFNFVGRKTDIEDITRKILDQNNQILTIKGSGGIGKTTVVSKVALELAKRNYFNDGIYFVDCEHITSYETFEQKIASCFQLEKTSEFREHLKQNHLMADKLIILDNFEPLLYLSQIKKIKELVNFICDYTQVLITSREWIGFDFENRHELRLLSTEEAYELFIKLYRVKNDEMEIKILKEYILEKLLNNNPLAIKLITKISVPNMSMSSLKKELTDDFFSATTLGYEDIFNEAVDQNIERSESVFQSINYSYKRLKPKEQLALEMLCLFPNGIFLENFKKFFDSKEFKVEANKVSYREIKSLENKSLVETSGGIVKLQSIIGRFAEVHFEKRSSQEKSLYYKRAFQYNEYLANTMYYLESFHVPTAQRIYDKNNDNFTK
ncbi:NACHT domain-containing protein [Metabacillus dongyingensis]|uniref:NACHT domain-containing protein n=1 Tax=Metabacillus dongyingensis TaxID=2874282 RepID=UPI001FB1D8EE|nr:ATP-binding protein [Metabacillus dongyingensis]UNJ81301.1 hypothetical protein [Metabacillus dongyingensis]